ncbi:TetR/AcrR family transcriptional regulator [Kitasatospora sp. NPDC096147]|uniref:TetR/AcrR family transcriptional regulator n=1 Tax=Kitasatospora sp. NPDC096147 TaxID=3364093 RepID=UPI0038128596
MSTAKGSARRTAILDAAERTLVTSGHGALSLRAVAEAAGVRLGHLQYYFPSRERLVAELLARVLHRSLEQLGAEATAPGADPERLVEVVLAQQQDAELVRLFVELWALAAGDEAVAEAVRAFYADYARLVAGQIGGYRPELPFAECLARAESFIALVEGASLFRSGVAGRVSEATDRHLVRMARALLTADGAGGGCALCTREVPAAVPAD